MKFSRRAWLKLAGTSVLLPMFSDAMRSAQAAGDPKTRLILLMQSNGTSQPNFWPSGDMTSAILEPLTRHPSLRAKTTVIKGIYNHERGPGTAHDIGFAGLWTGHPVIGTFNDPWASGPSIDQVLARGLIFGVPYPTLHCGVLASDAPRLKDHRGSFSYVAARQQVPTETNLYKLYRKLFAPLEEPAVMAKRLAEQRSVLDYAAADLQKLRTRLGAVERDKLEVHETAIRDYERRLRLLAARPVPFEGCRAPKPDTLGVLDTVEDNVPTLTSMMLRFVAMASACQLAQIVTFQFGNAGERWRFRWLGIDKDSHADIAHKDEGKPGQVTDWLVSINRWYASQVADLALFLDSIPEGSGTALDHTLIVWGNEQATGAHGMDDIPIVFIGKGSGRLGRTGMLVDRSPQDFRRLGCTVQNIMGLPSAGFGNAPECGVLDGLPLAL